MLTDLVLFRHGKAVRPHEARDDFSRGLTARGKQEAAAQARILRQAGFVPDQVLVSTALRAAETWDAIQANFPGVPVRLDRELYLASPTVYLKASRAAKAARVMMIAHDPGLHDLARSLLKGDPHKSAGHAMLKEHLPTSGIAWFVGEDSSSSGFRLRHFWSPARTSDHGD